MRFDARDRSKPVVAEERNVLEDPALQVTDIRMLIGKGTFLVGDTSGRVRAWFHANSLDIDPKIKMLRRDPRTDGGVVVRGHEFPGKGAAVTALAASDRTRMAAVAYADGT